MTVLLVRHASAGDREEWEADDRLRPLDVRGRAQADGLVSLLERYAPTSVISSPSVRCVQTVEPLAQACGLQVSERPELAEGSSRGEVMGLIAALVDEVVVLCTHGDVVEELLGAESKKGSAWVLRLEHERLEALEYLPAPA